MEGRLPYSMLADAVLVVHFAIVVFVVGGLAYIVVGGLLNWRGVRRRAFRVAHLAAIGVVVAQAWLGRLCPLTVLESWLRERSGEGAYATSFVGHWVQRWLYYDVPLQWFALAYTVFGLLVIVAWWRFPPASPRRRPAHRA